MKSEKQDSVLIVVSLMTFLIVLTLVGRMNRLERWLDHADITQTSQVPAPVGPIDQTPAPTTIAPAPTSLPHTLSPFVTTNDKLVADQFTLILSGGALFYSDAAGDGETKTVRIQNYSTTLDYMSPGDYFMWISQDENITLTNDTPFAEWYKTVTPENYLGHQALRGEGGSQGESVGPNNPQRGYYFPQEHILITIFAKDTTGMNNAEKLLSAWQWTK